jgi:tetratricopeptide (TPR) repeat protein
VKIRSLAAWALVTGSALHFAGCATLSGPEAAIPPPATRHASPALDTAKQLAAPPDSADGPAVAAVATTDGEDGPSPVRWTGGVLADSAAAVKDGFNKVTDALTPAPPVPAGDDPVQLSSKAKPSPELYASLARFYEQSGKPAQAERIYQESMRRWPKHLGTALNYARFKDRQGAPQEAFRLYQDAAREFPKEAAVSNDVGLLFARQGRNQEAARAFANAIQLQPKRPLYRNNLAALLVEMDQPDQALVQLKAVCGEADAYYKLGYLMQEKRRFREAEALFARALQINPAMAEARVWLQHLQSDRPSEAQLAQRPVRNQIAAPAGPPHDQPADGARPPSIIRGVRTEPSAGPRAGPRSVPGWQGSAEVRPLPQTVAPLPRVNEEDNAGPPADPTRDDSSAQPPPLPDSDESAAAPSEVPLPDDTPDAPLPSDGGPGLLRPADERAPGAVRPLPPVEK